MLGQFLLSSLMSLTLVLPACTGTTSSSTPLRESSANSPVPEPRLEPTPPPPKKTIFHVQLSGDVMVEVTGEGLTAVISESSAKIGAPVSRLGILFREGGRLAEATWVMESGAFEQGWRSIAGRFWNPDRKEYQEGELPDWEVRLLSIDEQNANGSPRTVTIELRRKK